MCTMDKLTDKLFTVLTEDASEKHLAQFAAIITNYREKYSYSYSRLKRSNSPAACFFAAIEEACEYTGTL